MGTALKLVNVGCKLHTHQHMLCIVAIVGCTLHMSTHSMYCCYCCCTLHTHQHMLCIAAIVAVHYRHINTCYVLLLLLLYTTHINTCYVLLLLLLYTAHINTCYVLLLLLLYTTDTSTHVMYCCYCKLYPCTPCFHYKIIRTCCILLQLQLPSRTW